MHDYLGMQIDLSKDGLVQILMREYITKILDEIPDEFDGEATTPAANHLRKVDDGCIKLSEEREEFFHHNVAKLLFLSKRARFDIQIAISFLTTRVKSPDEDDYKKLARTMRYLRAAVDLTLTLEADGLGTIKWGVDVAFAVHQNIRGHTSAVTSLGKGAAFSLSVK